MRQEFDVCAIFLVDTRLKENEGTQSTLLKIQGSENLIVPKWITGTTLPLGRATK